jgi:hypothetical protein
VQDLSGRIGNKSKFVPEADEAVIFVEGTSYEFVNLRKQFPIASAFFLTRGAGHGVFIICRFFQFFIKNKESKD